MVAWSDTNARRYVTSTTHGQGKAKGFEELLETATSNANHPTFAQYEEIPT
jgi:hypothetical protein